MEDRQGNLDWVLLNALVFFTRDPDKYPDLVRATNQTNLKDNDMYWVTSRLSENRSLTRPAGYFLKPGVDSPYYDDLFRPWNP